MESALAAILRVSYFGTMLLLFTCETFLAFRESNYLTLTLCTLTLAVSLRYLDLFRIPQKSAFSYSLLTLKKHSTLSQDISCMLGIGLKQLRTTNDVNYRWKVQGLLNLRTAIAIADTGSQYNIMSKDFADRYFFRSVGPAKRFRLANSTVVSSQGSVSARWIFGRLNSSFDDSISYDLVFHVLEESKLDLVLGADTLHVTETLSKFSHRAERRLPNICASVYAVRLSLNLLGSACLRLPGMLSGKIAVSAIPDTGASCNMLNAAWARAHSLNINKSQEQRRIFYFADGSIQRTIGVVDTTWTFPDGITIALRFDVLEHCAAEVIISEEILHRHQVFQRYKEAILYVPSGSSACELQHFGFIKAKKKLQLRFMGKHSRTARGKLKLFMVSFHLTTWKLTELWHLPQHLHWLGTLPTQIAQNCSGKMNGT